MDGSANRGTGEANPAARRLDEAIARVYAKGEGLTPDVGGTATTGQFTEAVIREMKEAAAG